MQLPLALDDNDAQHPHTMLARSPPGAGAGAGGAGGAGGGGCQLAAAAVAERRRRGSGVNRREQMAVMEAALGSSLSHPNILQVCV